jgi:hypothetical protein
MGGSGSGRRPDEEARDSVRFFLEIHDKGASITELAQYTGLPRTLVQSQLHSMLTQGQVHKSYPDLRSALWHLSSPPAASRLTQAPPVRPRPARAHTRSR